MLWNNTSYFLRSSTLFMRESDFFWSFLNLAKNKFIPKGAKLFFQFLRVDCVQIWNWFQVFSFFFSFFLLLLTIIILFAQKKNIEIITWNRQGVGIFLKDQRIPSSYIAALISFTKLIMSSNQPVYSIYEIWDGVYLQ